MMNDDWTMTLPKIRKKYLKQVICPDKLTGECWNVIIDNLTLTFHYYWEDDDNEYLDSITMEINEDMAITRIYPIEAERQNYYDIRYSDYSPCRATELHYLTLDGHLEDACIPISEWLSMSNEEKAEKYQYALEYLSSWERLNPLPNKDHSFIPVLEKHIKELRCGQDG